MKNCEHTWIQENNFFRMCLDCGKSECSCGDNCWDTCSDGNSIEKDKVEDFFYDDYL